MKRICKGDLDLLRASSIAWRQSLFLAADRPKSLEPAWMISIAVRKQVETAAGSVIVAGCREKMPFFARMQAN